MTRCWTCKMYIPENEDRILKITERQGYGYTHITTFDVTICLDCKLNILRIIEEMRASSSIY